MSGREKKGRRKRKEIFREKNEVERELIVGFSLFDLVSRVGLKTPLNQVLKTRFIGGRHVKKVSTQTQSEHENLPSKTRFIVKNQAS